MSYDETIVYWNLFSSRSNSIIFRTHYYYYYYVIVCDRNSNVYHACIYLLRKWNITCGWRCVSVGQYQELSGPLGGAGCRVGRYHRSRRQGRQLESNIGPVLRSFQIQTETETTAESRESQVENTDGYEAIEVMFKRNSNDKSRTNIIEWMERI